MTFGNLTKYALAGALFAGLAAAPNMANVASADPSFSLDLPGFGLHVGPRGHTHKNWAYKNYNRKYYGKRHKRYGNYSCGYWANQCSDRWGYRSGNWYGCMRNRGC